MQCRESFNKQNNTKKDINCFCCKKWIFFYFIEALTGVEIRN